MDTAHILLTAGVGLIASLVTAGVTHILTKRQERRKYEREVAAKLVELNTTDKEITRIMARQYAQACLIVEKSSETERDRIFIPMGCSIALGRGATNEININDHVLSKTHAMFRASGQAVFVEPLSPTNGLTVNGKNILESKKLESGDVVSVPGSSFKITFVPIRS